MSRPAPPWPAVIAVAAVMAMASCRQEPAAPAPAGAGPLDPGSARPVAAQPAAARPAPAQPAGLPAACAEYRALIERLAVCGGGLPEETRAALRAGFERDAAVWRASPAASAEIEAACKRAAESVQLAASDVCGW